MKLSLDNTQKKQRVKNLWKLDYPPQDPELRWTWIYQVQDHLFGTREMQNKLLKAWGSLTHAKTGARNHSEIG